MMAMTGLPAGRAPTSALVDDVRFESDTEVIAHTLIRGGDPNASVFPGALPLTVAKQAVAELVDHNRGCGWHVVVREVAVLRVFRSLAAGDHLTTIVTCHAEPDDMLVAGGRCMRADLVIATVTMRLAVLPDEPDAEWGTR